MAGTALTGSFNPITTISSSYQWQVQGLLTALQPAVNADKSLTWQTATTDAMHAGVSTGLGMKGLTLASKTTMPAEELADIVRSTLRAMLSDQPQEPGMVPWKYDAALDGLVGPALEAVFANVAGSQNQPWFGWGPVTAASAVYNYNLLFAYTATSQPPGSFSVFILGLTVTVNLSEQQLLSLAPGTSATYTVTANTIPGMITEKTQMLS
jgi:Bacillus thuringiensis toxin